MASNTFQYKVKHPDASISDVVESFWMLENHSEADREIVVLPDGRIDVFFSYSAKEPFHTVLLGLETEPTKVLFSPGIVIFAVSLNLLAVEYLLRSSVSHLINQAEHLPDGFWNIQRDDLVDFERFCDKAATSIKAQLREKTDERKRKLFKLLYASKGSMTVKELSEEVGWSSRQINRYFTEQFGLSLKAYCGILRFRASFQHIREGKLFPEQNFADQAHFIKEVKKLSGVVPKKLSQNQNDRFIQFSTLPKA
jgi:AraC-like DNA-binding protein